MRPSVCVLEEIAFPMGLSRSAVASTHSRSGSVFCGGFEEDVHSHEPHSTRTRIWWTVKVFQK
jgi:hypothetical protein